MTTPSKALQAAAAALAMALAFGVSISPASAKNKENCHANGGKWLPGSTTDPEKGACLYLIRAGGGSKDDLKKLAAEGATTADACTRKGGKISRDKSQCTIPMGK